MTRAGGGNKNKNNRNNTTVFVIADWSDESSVILNINRDFLKSNIITRQRRPLYVAQWKKNV